MPRATNSVSALSKERLRHKPLSEDLNATGLLREKLKKRKALPSHERENSFIDSRSSRKILKISQDLVDEEHFESTKSLPKTAFTPGSRFEEPNDSDNESHQQEEDMWGDDDDDEPVDDVVRSFQHEILHIPIMLSFRGTRMSTRRI